MSRTPSDDEGLREELADICRTGHYGIAETKVVNDLMALISQKIIDELETLISHPHRGGLNNTELRIQRRIATLTTKQDTKEK